MYETVSCALAKPFLRYRPSRLDSSWAIIVGCPLGMSTIGWQIRDIPVYIEQRHKAFPSDEKESDQSMIGVLGRPTVELYGLMRCQMNSQVIA